MRKILLAAGTTAALAMAAPALSGEPDECGEIQFGQVNWTGVSAKTETAAWLLEQLGYETDVVTASVPIMFESLASEEIDAFLGLWLPTQRGMIEERMRAGAIDIVGPNLRGAKYTVAVSQDAYDAGVTSFSELAEHYDEFDGKIYGIEAGNDGNEIILSMIDNDAYGLGDWELVESSEAGMLSEVERHTNRGDWIAFLGWAPHPMNINYDMDYLHGGEDYWGPDQGGATVYTMARTGYAWQCQNVGQFLENYTFTVEEQSIMAGHVLNDGMDYDEAGRALAREHPELLERWFDQGGTFQTGAIQSRDGDAALDVIRDALDL